MTRLAIIVGACAGACLFALPALAGSTPACVAGPGQLATECGMSSVTANDFSTAVGGGAQAIGKSATALGVIAGAKADGATAVGGDAAVAGPSGTAVGFISASSGFGAVAVGAQAVANGAAATALGLGAQATHAGSTALGAAAQTTRAAQVLLGAPGTSVAIGDIGASTAVQSGPVSHVTVDANGTLGRDTATLPGLIGGQAALFDLANTINVQAQRGIAAAAAVTTAPLPSAPGRVSYAANGSVYRGQFAFGASAAYRFDTAKPFALTGGVGVAGKGDTVGRVGVAGEF